jgi:putative endonuclease
MKNLFKQEEGKLGEDFAVSYLKKIGYKIIDRNFRIQGGEIDIIALDPSTGSGQAVLVFIEVKTRKSSEFGTPLEAITYWKIKSLIKTAHFYKTKHPSLSEEMRIDAIGIMLDKFNNLISIELVKNVTS